jgi:hypothetical protein
MMKRQLEYLKDIKMKALRNVITETMLEVITSRNNLDRIVTPINFKPILDAIDSIKTSNEGLLPKTKYDLSKLSDEYLAYSSLSSGAILTGAFANAVKVFAYLSQAGEQQAVADLRNQIKGLEKAMDAQKQIVKTLAATKKGLPEGADASDLVAQAEAATYEQQQIATLIFELKADMAKITKSTDSFRSQLNTKYHYRVKMGGNDVSFNSITTWDINNQYQVTEVFDTLINAAIDNLKLGYLSQARINTMTGSAVTGMLFTGMPMEMAIKILYQPVFKPLTTGRIYRLDSFISDYRKQYSSELDALEDEVLSDTEIEYGLKNDYVEEKIGSVVDKDFNDKLRVSQHKAFLLFEKANKIGEDVRNMASFLDIIRQMDVFIEDLDQKDMNLARKIGTVRTAEDGTISLEPRADFSFNTRNLFEKTPHIQESYKTHALLQSTISQVFTIHSENIRDMARTVNSGLNMNAGDDIENAADNLSNIRRTLVSYVLSALV